MHRSRLRGLPVVAESVATLYTLFRPDRPSIERSIPDCIELSP